jgi:hypothetical protein
MLHLLGKALTAMVLDGDAREALEDAGGFVSTIQGSADMRTVIQQIKTERQVSPSIGGYTPLTSPSTVLTTTLSSPAVMANSAALQAALIAEILASARATAAGVERPVASNLKPPAPAPVSAPAAPRAPARSVAPAQPYTPPPTSPLPGSAGTLHAAIMAQALATARNAVSGHEAPPTVPQMPPLRAPAAAPAGPPSRPPRGKRLPPAERAQLIQNALKVHSAKQAVLSNLTGEQRAKLAELASKLLDPQSGSGEA